MDTTTNLLLEQDWYGRQQLSSFLDALGKANPGGQWTRKIERMGIDANDNVIGDMWFKAEIYKLNGHPIFEVVTKCDREEWNDLRSAALSQSGESK